MATFNYTVASDADDGFLWNNDFFDPFGTVFYSGNDGSDDVAPPASPFLPIAFLRFTGAEITDFATETVTSATLTIPVSGLIGSLFMTAYAVDQDNPAAPNDSASLQVDFGGRTTAEEIFFVGSSATVVLDVKPLIEEAQATYAGSATAFMFVFRAQSHGVNTGFTAAAQTATLTVVTPDPPTTTTTTTTSGPTTTAAPTTTPTPTTTTTSSPTTTTESPVPGVAFSRIVTRPRTVDAQRARANVFYLRVRDVNSRPWSFEMARVRLREGGKAAWRSDRSNSFPVTTTTTSTSTTTTTPPEIL